MVDNDREISCSKQNMALVNEHFLKVGQRYLFSDIAKKVNAYNFAHPKQRVMSVASVA